MKVPRRRFIELSAIGIGGLAGCTALDNGNSGTSTDTPTETATPTETVTPTPTGPASFEIESTDGSETVTVGDQFQITATIQNTGGESGTFEAPLETSVPSRDEWQELRTISIEIPPGETRTWESNQVTAQREQVGTFQYRLGGASARWEITIEADTLAPQIQEVNLVEDWESYGDAIERSITAASAGEEITIAWRYDYIIAEGQLQVFEQCRIYNTDTDERVANRTLVDEQIFSREGYTTFEHGFDFATTDWKPGEYRAEVTLRDEVSGEVSNTETTTFELR